MLDYVEELGGSYLELIQMQSELRLASLSLYKYDMMNKESCALYIYEQTQMKSLRNDVYLSERRMSFARLQISQKFGTQYDKWNWIKE